MRRFILVAALLLSPVVASAQMGHPLRADTLIYGGRGGYTVRYDWLTHVVGFTICMNGQGISFVRAGQSDIERRDTETHELTHAAQISRAPSCEDFDKVANTMRGSVILEAEAYAAGLCTSVKLGVNRESLEQNYAERISWWVTKGQVRPREIWEIIRAFEKC